MKYRNLRQWMCRLALLAGSLVLIAGGAARAGEFELRGSEYVQTNWAPNRYQVFCGDYNAATRDLLGLNRVDTDVKRDAPCFSPEFNRLIEALTAKRLMGIKAMGFRAPRYFGPRINPVLVGTPYIRLYDTNAAGFANTTVICTNKIIRIRIGKTFREFADRSYLISYFLSHELFHVVQQAYPVSSKTQPCGITKGWIGESTADVVALDLTRRAYSYRFPADNEREARRFAGLRRYYVPLNIKINDKKMDMTGHPIHYNTGSFWRHIAQTYHGGKYKFIHDYFRVRPSGGDWLAWLDNRLLTDPKIRMSLAHVYQGFVADFAGWGDKGMPGQFFGRQKWLSEAFGKCAVVWISPENPQDMVTISLRPTSAKCIRVHVTGLEPNDRTSIKVAALAGPPVSKGSAGAKLTDQLQLSLAMASDSSNHHCARAVRKKQLMGLLNCVFVADTGTLRWGGGAEKPARVWYVHTQEAGRAKKEGREATPRTQQVRRGGFTNLYILSRVAVRPTDREKIFKGGEHLTATVYFMLDVGRLKTTGSAGPAGGGGGQKKRVVAHLNGEAPTNSQEGVPLWDANGSRTITKTNPSAVRPQLPFRNPGSPYTQGPLKGMVQFMVSSVEVRKQGLGEETLTTIETFVATPLKRQGQGYVGRPLQIGQTGVFPASIAGGSKETSYASRNPGRLVVSEFSRLMLRARFSGTVCRVLPPTPGVACPDPRHIEASIVKPFPGSYLPEGAFTVYDTPGTKAFRRIKANWMRRWMGSGSQGPGGGAGPGGGGGGGGGAAGGDQGPRCCYTTKRAWFPMRMPPDRCLSLPAGAPEGSAEARRFCSTSRTIAMPPGMGSMGRGGMGGMVGGGASGRVGAGGASSGCACTCEEFDKLRASMRAMRGGGGMPDMSAIRKLSQCMRKCQQAYSRCRKR